MKNDIKTHDDIRLLVNSFYDKVREDNLLGPVFNDVIQNNWPGHLEKMYSFWATILLGVHDYHGNPFSVHIKLPVKHVHFVRWVELFTKTSDELFSGEKAEEAKRRAKSIADIFEHKLKHIRNV